MSGWQVRAITFDPPVLYTTAREDIIISLDLSALLIDDDPPTLPETVLIRQELTVHTVITLQDTPTMDDNFVQQRLRGLTSGGMYKLYVSVLTNGMRREGDLNIVCVWD
jgi:hypothetical protein